MAPAARAPAPDANVVVSQSRLLWTTSAPNSVRRRRPRRRYAFAPRPRPAGDQSSVPSTPKTSSACAPRLAIVSLQDAPSPARMTLELRCVCIGVRREERALAVRKQRCRSDARCSGTRARARQAPSPSSACAGPPTQSGCQALKTSWWKPGSVSSAVRTAPPSSASRSRTATRQPARARNAAQASELMPLPTMTAS